jgi:peptidoglycan/LPS O-acetylase OafA/YrhL
MSATRADGRIIEGGDATTSPSIGTAAAEPAPAPRRFRPDIQGLRAVAILLVVLYHAGVPLVQGGYVGVDVFFVISGYLITGQLVAEVVKSGRIALATFYLKRVRRLLPSAIIVIIVTLLVARAVAPPLFTISLGVDGIFAALYTLNYRLAAQEINYQNAGAAPSAFQHFWSLGAEEQFYLVWPLLIIVALVLSRRWWRDLLPVLFVVVLGVSLYISQYLLSSDAPMSYFSVQSRAWEFAAGALVALASGALAGVPPRIRAVMAITGLAAILFAGAVYNAGTEFPGVKALIPVLGSVLVVSAGCGPRLRTEAILDSRVMQWIGKISYPWYLWHWPILVLAPYIWPRVTFTWPLDLGLMAFSLIPAAATYYGLELPIRKVGFNIVVWAAAGLCLMTVAVATGRYVDTSQTALLAASGVTASPTAPGSAEGAVSKKVVDPFSNGRTSGAVDPSVPDAASDNPGYPADCIVPYAATESPKCLIDQYGNATSAPIGANRVVLLGDSHAGEWYPDVYGIARQHGWDTEVLNKEGCPLAGITVENAAADGPYSQCGQWRANMFQRLREEPRPKVIFIASLNYYTSDNTYLANGWKTTLAALRAIGAPIVYLRDTPYPNYNVPTCVSGALSDWSACSFKRSVAFHADPLMAGTAASHGLAARVDMDDYLCPAADAECPAVLGGILLYRDNSRVTNTAMSMLLPAVQEQLQPLVQSVLKP